MADCNVSFDTYASKLYDTASQIPSALARSLLMKIHKFPIRLLSSCLDALQFVDV